MEEVASGYVRDSGFRVAWGSGLSSALGFRVGS